MSNYFDFTDRASYLVASTSWKADYRAHATMIRKLKHDFKDAQRAFAKVDPQDCKYYEMPSKDRDAYFAASRVVDALRSQLQKAKAKATEMVNDRISMKEEAQRQYEDAKSVA